MKRKTLTTLIVMICLCLPLVHIQVKTCTAQGSTFKLVDVLIDYGNGTSRWASCILQPGEDTVYNATQKVVVSLEVSWWGTDAFVEAIDDVRNSYPYYWMWWYWNRYTECWELGPVACNQYVLAGGDTIAWYYEDCSVWPLNQPLVTMVDILL
ncbi:MAG: hypothetical protein QW577_04605, partial [Candidatus Bathyarchaeia archaeon]